MKDLESMSVTELIDEYRRGEGDSHGWRAELARQAGVHRSFIGNIARGKAKGAGPDVRRRLIEAVRAQRARVIDAAEPRVSATPHSSAADSELAIMQALTDLDEAARRRIIAWANDRWGRV